MLHWCSATTPNSLRPVRDRAGRRGLRSDQLLNKRDELGFVLKQSDA